ncbi:MAG: porin [Rhodocyclaceae bacterium]|nr:porin [Rhodocyclaceae bacterium]
MQKKLIALAVAGLASSAAFAQSNVTVYGVVDVTFENVKADDAAKTPANNAAAINIPSRNRVTSNSSYIGFKGEEALGNGLKAKFLFESGFTADNGGALSGGRDSYVALGSNFGEVRLGQYNTAVRTLGSTIDFAPGYTGIGAISNVIGTLGGVKTGSDDRISNAVGYFSPNWSGFQVSAIYGANENKTDGSADGTVTSKNNNRYDLGASYTNGGLYVGAAYGESKDNITAANANTVTGNTYGTNGLNSKLKNTRIGAKYTFAATGTSISALWDQQKAELNQFNNAAISGDVKRDAWEIGVKQDFGAHSIYGTFAKANDLKFNGNKADNTGVKSYTLGYLYNFSKRTSLKAYYTALKNDANIGTDFYNNPVSGGTPGAVGADPKGYGVGLRHSF